MKLSIAWIFDHIQGSWKDQDIPALIAKLGATTAEIDHVKLVEIDLDALHIARVVKVSSESITLVSLESKKEFALAPLKNQTYTPGTMFMVVKENKQYRFATLSDLGSDKEASMPAVSCTDEEAAGGWKKQYEHHDYVITLDNKAVTHRPDLWGHRGFAREIAAMLNLPLRAEDDFLASKPIKHYDKATSATAGVQVKIETDVCKRFAALPVPAIEYTPAVLKIALRLARIDARPIDAIVDATNYVMYDWGQPMHAFDAAKISHNSLIAQQARAGEKLTLLDGETITLTPDDCIISDGQKALALAGIMGGDASSVTPQTHSLIIEAANFDATAIRLTAARYKKRTEASTRFEKVLDPHQNTQAILRFLKILETEKISFTAGDAISSLGALSSDKTITVAHDFIQAKLGIMLSVDKVITILKSLGFGVQHDKKSNLYFLIVPTYRATKDIAIPEDIVEEVGRFIGYGSIKPQAPVRAMIPIDHHDILTMRAIKQHCAYGLKMHEVYNYAFYDEEFIRKLDLNFFTTAVVNPVSENYKGLVTSLVPHLLKNIQQMAVNNTKLSFFEAGRIWETTVQKLQEKAVLGLVMYDRANINFYEGKERVHSLFDLLRMQVTWRKPVDALAPWFDQHQAAELVCEGVVIGHAGKIAPTLAPRVGEGDIFIAEFSLDALLKRSTEKQVFKQLAKYQPVELDVSVLLAYTVAAESLELAIASADERIRDVRIVDFFEKEEWQNRRSLTMRYMIVDETKTLTKEDIDAVHAHVIKTVQKLGAEVR